MNQIFTFSFARCGIGIVRGTLQPCYWSCFFFFLLELSYLWLVTISPVLDRFIGAIIGNSVGELSTSLPSEM